MPKRNTKAMNEYNKNIGNETRERVLAAIEQCKADGDVSVKKVCEIANVNRSYFSKYPELRNALDIAMGIVNRKIKKRKQNNNSKDVLIKSLYVKIASLENIIKKLQSLEKYKDLYEEKCKEVENLKNQLDNAYGTSGLMDF